MPVLLRIPTIPAKASPNSCATVTAEALADHLDSCRQLLVLTGAGLSAASGIPAYRDSDGQWRRRQPIMYQAFMSDPTARQRYWARSYVGWPHVAAAQPTAAHYHLVALQALGRLGALITQNVDQLHQRAGARDVLDLHGNLHQVRCVDCGLRLARSDMQERLASANPGWQADMQALRPDGDAELEAAATQTFKVPACPACQGRLKPDVVFFGESVPASHHQRVAEALVAADGVLVVGSSLVVMSGYRIVRDAATRGLLTVAINQGRTRADGLLRLKCMDDCQHALQALVQRWSG